MADSNESGEETNGPQPSIIVKLHAPEESSENSANDEADGQSAEENSQTPPSPSSKFVSKIQCPVLAQSKFGNSFGISEFSKSILTFGGISMPTLLRPSQLSTIIATNSPGSSLKSDTESLKNNNPFIKVTDKDIIDDNNSEKKILDNTKDEKTNSESNNKEIKLSTTEDSIPAPKFLPLGNSPKETDTNVNNSVGPNCSTSSFVFGQNLKERVAVAKDNDGPENSEDKESNDETSAATENGSSELLFSSAATVCRSTSRPGLTLTQAAQEMEEANRANKRKYSQVALLTGEEGETNILQVNCKLFAFDKVTSGWKERGRGILRLNDRDEESRLVGRATGTQRLILNTKVWPGMTAERAGPKSLRLTAMDIHGDVRIFIVQAAPNEVDQLHNHLMQRLKRAKERQPKKLATDH
ncbi:hypothetical protein PV325_007263 [Microctonus aethiopoides]|nr:hypothetical protein PV325_007263 [Microctonus aethiopoides]